MSDKSKQRAIFPIDLFPTEVSNYIEEISGISNFPRNILGTSALFAMASAIGNSFELQIKRNYTQKAILYGMLAAKSGTGKTPMMNYMYKPLRAIAKKWRKKRYQKIQQIKETESNEINPPLKLTTFGNATSAGIEKHAPANPKGLSCVADELTSWFLNLNAYSAKNEKDFHISGWNGEYAENLLSSADKSYFDPFCVILGGIQNGRLSQIYNSQDLFSGFVARFLVSFSETDSTPVESMMEVSEETYQQYSSLILRIFMKGFEDESDIHSDYIEENKRMIVLTEEAQSKLINYRNSLRVDAQKHSEAIIASYNKLTDYSYRFALILHIISAISKGEEPSVVKSEDAAKAIELTEYFRKSAHELDDEMCLGDPADKLPEDFKNLLQLLSKVDTFSKQDAIEASQSIGMDVSDKTIERFYKRPDLFKRLKRNCYTIK